MNYNEMLNKILSESGKMHKDIAEECSKYGVKLTNTYLSSLKTTPGKIPSDDISRAIAKACGAEYEEVLVVQAYLDKAPDIIIEYLENIRESVQDTQTIAGMFGKGINPESEVLIDEINKTKQKSLAEFICESVKEQREMAEMNIFEQIQPKVEEMMEPKWMLISPEQMKNITLVKESDVKKIIEDEQ